MSLPHTEDAHSMQNMSNIYDKRALSVISLSSTNISYYNL